jgi:hypothetical protein
MGSLFLSILLAVSFLSFMFVIRPSHDLITPLVVSPVFTVVLLRDFLASFSSTQERSSSPLRRLTRFRLRCVAVCEVQSSSNIFQMIRMQLFKMQMELQKTNKPEARQAAPLSSRRMYWRTAVCHLRVPHKCARAFSFEMDLQSWVSRGQVLQSRRAPSLVVELQVNTQHEVPAQQTLDGVRTGNIVRFQLQQLQRGHGCHSGEQDQDAAVQSQGFQMGQEFSGTEQIQHQIPNVTADA